MKYDLAVAYRIYPKVSAPARGLPFADDKLKMAEVCLRSFRRSLGRLRAKVWAILDSCPKEYVLLFQSVFASEDLVLVPLEDAGNAATFIKQVEILSLQQDAELVYFAEDDYFYLANEFDLITGFIKEKDVDFVSPYDHLDCYTTELHRAPKWIRVFREHHWRTAASTCLTFLTTRPTLLATERVLRSYGQGNSDCSMWLSLTKQRIFNPVDFVRWLKNDSLFPKLLVKAWLFGGKQILLGRRYRLWVPVPGIATHLAGGLMSPGPDWTELMQADDFLRNSQHS